MADAQIKKKIESLLRREFNENSAVDVSEKAKGVSKELVKKARRRLD
jgi:hypothetical protein